MADQDQDKGAPLGVPDPTKDEPPKKRTPIRPEFIDAASHPLDQTPGSAVGPAPGTYQGSVSGVPANDVTPTTPEDAAEKQAATAPPNAPGGKH